MDDSHDFMKKLFGDAKTFYDRIALAKIWLDKNLRNDAKKARAIIDLIKPEAIAAGDKSGEAWLLFFSSWSSLLIFLAREL